MSKIWRSREAHVSIHYTDIIVIRSFRCSAAGGQVCPSQSPAAVADGPRGRRGWSQSRCQHLCTDMVPGSKTRIHTSKPPSRTLSHPSILIHFFACQHLVPADQPQSSNRRADRRAKLTQPDQVLLLATLGQLPRRNGAYHGHQELNLAAVGEVHLLVPRKPGEQVSC